MNSRRPTGKSIIRIWEDGRKAEGRGVTAAVAGDRIGFIKRKTRMKILTAVGLLLGMLGAAAGCAKEVPAESGVQDIVPENGTGADGTFGSEPFGSSDIVSTQGGAVGNGGGAGTSGGRDAGTQETAQAGRLTVTLPAGYTESTTSGLYLNQNYPDDQSNIYIYTTEKTNNFEQTMAGGQEQFIRYLADAYEEQYGERPDITLTRYEAVSVWNQPAYVVELSYHLRGVHYDQLEYIVDADQTYYVAFSQVGSGSWMEAFRGSAETMIFSEAE